MTDAVEVIGFANALELVRGGPTAASDFLRLELGSALIDGIVPELSVAIRLANDPLIGEALGALTGVRVGEVAGRIGRVVDDAIWGEIGREEAAIRADPRRTNDPLLMGVFGVTNRL